MTTTIDSLGKLREPFPAEVIGKLPRVTCPACSKRECQRHEKRKCMVCDAYVSESHIHLDYVGHAEVTDRLLSVDPEWTWEPVAFTAEGLPAIGRGAGTEIVLWIRLTVCGVTRLGVGSVASGAFDTEKQLVGDAIRNASMRFGVALDLWAKSELESTLGTDEPPAAFVPPATTELKTEPPAAVPPAKTPDDPEVVWASTVQLNAIRRLLNANLHIRDDEGLCKKVGEIVGRTIDDPGKITEAEADQAAAELGKRAA